MIARRFGTLLGVVLGACALSSSSLHAAAPPKHAVVAAAEGAAGASPLPEGARATAKLLEAIARHESSLRDDVVRCRTLGDHGRAYGAYQLHAGAFGSHDAVEVCASDDLQARLALATLHVAYDLHPEDGIKGALQIYASGRRKSTKASREILAIYRRLLKGKV